MTPLPSVFKKICRFLNGSALSFENNAVSSNALSSQFNFRGFVRKGCICGSEVTFLRLVVQHGFPLYHRLLQLLSVYFRPLGSFYRWRKLVGVGFLFQNFKTFLSPIFSACNERKFAIVVRRSSPCILVFLRLLNDWDPLHYQTDFCAVLHRQGQFLTRVNLSLEWFLTVTNLVLLTFEDELASQFFVLQSPLV